MSSSQTAQSSNSNLRDMDQVEKQETVHHNGSVHHAGSSEDGEDLANAPSRVNLERIPTYLQPPLALRQRLQHFTFAWYTLTMSTGGIALALGNLPYRFRGLNEIGLIIYFFDLVCFALITACICLRFVLYKGTFRKTVTRPREALLVPTFFLSIATILSNAAKYGVLFLSGERLAGLSRWMRVMYWMYLAATFLFSIFQYHLVFTVKEKSRRLSAASMTPGWILPIFPVMLTGTIAAACSAQQSPENALAMIFAGVLAQGLGFLVSVFLYATYISRLISTGLPEHRPAMFIAVGPPSFTCVALLGMASDIPRIFETQVPMVEGMLSPAILAEAIKLIALCGCIFLWGLSFWFFVMATVGVLSRTWDREYHLNWWSFVFPNVGFALSNIRVGTVVNNAGLKWFGTALVIILVAAWLFVFVRSAYAVFKREIVWPGHDEDSD